MFMLDKRKCFVFGLVLLLGLFLFIIPSKFPTEYLSPDETAVAVAAREFGTAATVSLKDELLELAPWVHPRSWVSRGGSMVPVGFLGLPILAGLVWKLFGEFGLLFLTPLLVLSTIFPLWRFFKRLGWYAQVSGIATWLSLPTVILYANRGLFPNLILVCLMVWSAYLVWEKPNPARLVSAGFLFGLAGAIRPTELAWMVVWVAAAWLARQGVKESSNILKSALFFGLGAVPFPAASAGMAWLTYGTPFTVGYWLRDPETAASSIQQATSVPAWPFGFHPRNVWFNLKGYVLGLLAPWFLVSVGAAAAWLLRKRPPLPVVAGFATFVLLALVYGQAVYQDHVGHNIVSIGNSYLRYLLPMAPFMAAAVAGMVGLTLEKMKQSSARLFAFTFAGALAIIGVWTAVDHDAEGLRQSSAELERYGQVRQAAFEKYGRKAIVLSDRSDKIFFPVFRAVSPMPDDAKLTELVQGYPEHVLIFSTSLDEEGVTDWMNRGFVLFPSFATKNQTLYEVSASSSVDLMWDDVWPEEL